MTYNIILLVHNNYRLKLYIWQTWIQVQVKVDGTLRASWQIG